MTIPSGRGRPATPTAVNLTSDSYSPVTGSDEDGILVSLSEANSFLNVDHSEDDRLITMLIHAAESEVEKRLNRDLRARTYEAYFRTADVGDQVYFYGTDRAANAVTSVKMWNASNVETTLDSDGEDAEYAVLSGKGGEMVVALDTDVLSNYSQGSDAGDFMRIAFSTADATAANLAGYFNIKRAVMHIVAGGYEAREEVAQGAQFAENPAVERLLRPYVKRLSVRVL